jgi:hypothetical protein
MDEGVIVGRAVNERGVNGQEAFFIARSLVRCLYLVRSAQTLKQLPS